MKTTWWFNRKSINRAPSRLHLLIPLVLACFGLPLHARAQPVSSATKYPDANAYANSKLTYKITDAPNSSYGYDLSADGRLMIHQTSVPALPGNEGFRTKEDATKVALLVIEKIRKGQMPPTISIDEMKTRNVLK